MKNVYIFLLVVTLLGGIMWYVAQPETVIVEEDQEDTLEYSHERIQVNTPTPNQPISSPLTAAGEARSMWFFEADFPMRIMDANGIELGVGIATAQEEWMVEDFVPFTGTIEFSTPTTPTGTIIFERDNASGLPEHDDSFSFPIQFSEYHANEDNANQEQTVDIYFYNQTLDTDTEGNIICSVDSVLSAERTIPHTTTPARDVVELVLAGDITAEESAQGLSTEYPLSGVSLADITLHEGILTIELNDPELSTSGGSCRVTLLRAQLEKTVLQFETVNEVVILPEDTFQP